MNIKSSLLQKGYPREQTYPTSAPFGLNPGKVLFVQQTST